MMRRTPFLLFSLCVVSIIWGCRETAIPPPGSYSEVLLVTEDGKASKFVPYILPQLIRELNFYTSEEKQFSASVIRAEELEDFPTFKNIVLLGTTDELTSIGQRISTLLGPSGVDKVRRKKAFIFKRENIPASGQLTLIITACNDEELTQVLEEQGKDIPDVIEASCRKRLRRFLLDHEDKELSSYLFRKYGFVIEVPKLYRIMSEKRHPAGIELMREGPARSLGVFWVDWKRPPTEADVKELFRIRADYVYKRYDGDVMDSTRVHFSGCKLGPYQGIKMEGYWYNTRATAGGCYMTYFIFEEKEKLLWAVDLLVFAPGSKKHPYFRELLALSETFRYD